MKELVQVIGVKCNTSRPKIIPSESIHVRPDNKNLISVHSESDSRAFISALWWFLINKERPLVQFSISPWTRP